MFCRVCVGTQEVHQLQEHWSIAWNQVRLSMGIKTYVRSHGAMEDTLNTGSEYHGQRQRLLLRAAQAAHYPSAARSRAGWWLMLAKARATHKALRGLGKHGWRLHGSSYDTQAYVLHWCISKRSAVTVRGMQGYGDLIPPSKIV